MEDRKPMSTGKRRFEDGGQKTIAWEMVDGVQKSKCLRMEDRKPLTGRWWTEYKSLHISVRMKDRKPVFEG
jgi:hypothetical protein